MRRTRRVSAPGGFSTQSGTPSPGYNGRENALVTVIGIFGPTASGKSRVAEAVADRLDGGLVSADAMQAYEGLPILTNQSAARLVGGRALPHQAPGGRGAP